MLQSYLFSKIKNALSKSYFLKFLINQVDVKEELKYESIITASLYKPIVYINSLLGWIANHTVIEAVSKRVDLKSVVIFLFIVSQVLFPGYGTENTGTAFLAGSPVGSIANRTGFLLNLIVFAVSFAALEVVFLVDIGKKSNAFKLSKFEVLLVIFIICIASSSIFSVYPDITFTWFIKVLRGIAMYFIFSRLIIDRNQILAVCLAFLSVIYIEAILAIFQYIHGGFVGIPLETAKNVTSSNQLYTLLSDTPIFRPTGTLAQENVLSFLLAFILPFTLVFLFDKRKYLRISSILSIFLVILASAITLSRWGTTTLIFSLAIFLFITFIVKGRKIRINAIFRTSIIFITILLPFFIIKNDILIRFTSFSPNDTSFIHRLELIKQAIYVIKNNLWLGIGGGTFSKYLINYDYTSLDISQIFAAPIHNFYLLIISETGFISFFLLTTLILYIGISFFKKTQVLQSFHNQPTLLLLISSFVVICAYLFNGLWTLRALDEHLAIIFWVNLGFFINLLRSNKLQFFS